VKRFVKFVIIAVFSFTTLNVLSQKAERKGEFYFSWGYNKAYYTQTNVSINQPSLGNNFTFNNVKLVDNPGWNDALFTLALSIPQYNYRIGYFFDKEKDLAFEINFDHTKALFKNGQTVNMSGTYNGRSVDSSFVFSKSGTGSSKNYYYLNNGANFLLFKMIYSNFKPNNLRSFSSTDNFLRDSFFLSPALCNFLAYF
jgi:hypothetical protein